MGDKQYSLWQCVGFWINATAKRELVGNCSSWIAIHLAASHMFSLVEYDKVVVLDTDVLIRNDMDELFGREAPAAVSGDSTDSRIGSSKIILLGILLKDGIV